MEKIQSKKRLKNLFIKERAPAARSIFHFFRPMSADTQAEVARDELVELVNEILKAIHRVRNARDRK